MNEHLWLPPAMLHFVPVPSIVMANASATLLPLSMTYRASAL